MGWVIQREDASIRAWYANAQDGRLQDGETWVEMDECPEITSGVPDPDPLTVGMARPEIQAVLDLIAQQQNTTVDDIQAQAITAHTAALASRSTERPA